MAKRDNSTKSKKSKFEFFSKLHGANLRAFASTLLLGLFGLFVISGFFFLGQLQSKKELEPKIIELEKQNSELLKSLNQGKKDYKDLEFISKAQETYAKRLENITGSFASIATKQDSLIGIQRETTSIISEAWNCLLYGDNNCVDQKLGQIKVKMNQINALDEEISSEWKAVQKDFDFLRKAGIL